jgi:hypothetical protein
MGEGSGLRVQGSWLRVESLGCRVEGLILVLVKLNVKVTPAVSQTRNLVRFQSPLSSLLTLSIPTRFQT